MVYDVDYGDIPEDINCAKVLSIDNIYTDAISINVWNIRNKLLLTLSRK